MPTVAAIAAFLEQLAPLRLAEEWDNVGLLVGDRDRSVTKLMTCLTVTPASAAEAVEAGAELIVAHHPFPFTAVNRITTDTTVGQMLLDLAAARIAVFSAHTAIDSAAEGINQRLAAGLELRGIGRRGAPRRRPRRGPMGMARRSASAWQTRRAAQAIPRHRTPATRRRPAAKRSHSGGGVRRAGELLDAARQNGCDAMVVGEARFHTCLEAKALGIALLLPGHYASERFAVEALADILARQFADVQVWPSRREKDPIGECEE